MSSSTSIWMARCYNEATLAAHAKSITSYCLLLVPCLWAREFFTIFLHAWSSNWKKNWAQWDGIFAVCNCLKHHNLPYLYFRCGGMKIFASFIYTAYPTPRKFPNMYVFQKRFMTSDCFLCHLYQIEFGKLCLSHSGKSKEIWIWNNGCIRSEHSGGL